MKRSPLSPAHVAALALQRLAAMADSERARQVQRYFKETVRSFGVGSPQVRELARELYGTVRGSWTVADAISLCDRLLQRPELEAKSVGTLVLLRFHKDFPRRLFATIRGWLARDRLDNWASVDVFCPQALATLLRRRWRRS